MPAQDYEAEIAPSDVDAVSVPVTPAWFDTAPEQVADARAWLREVIALHGVNVSVGAQAELLLSELVTNVVLHSWSSRVGLTAKVTRSSLTVGVIEDRASGLGRHAQPSAAAPMPSASGDASHGRGLGILDWLASEWGTRRRGGVTTSWFTVDHDAGPTADDTPTANITGPAVEVPTVEDIGPGPDRSEQYLLGLAGGGHNSPHTALIDYLRGSQARSDLLLRLTEKLSDATTPDEVGEAITGTVRNHLGAVFSGIALVGEDDRTMQYLSLDPLPAQTAARWGSFPLDRSAPVSAAALESKAYFHPTVAAAEREFPGIGEHMRTAGTNALAHLPLTVAGRTIGTLCLAWHESRDMDPDLRALLLVIAGYAAQAMAPRPLQNQGPADVQGRGSAYFEYRRNQP